jgi:hypothetical protein
MERYKAIQFRTRPMLFGVFGVTKEQFGEGLRSVLTRRQIDV